MNLYASLLRPLLFRLSADRAHDVAVAGADWLARVPGALGVVRRIYGQHPDPRLQQTFWGLNFANPVGIAAGFDKNARALPLLQALGFGFLEIGSITARPSPGNPRPRSFRLPLDASLINRLGLNNDGAMAVTERLAQRALGGIPIGVNIAKTHDPAILGAAALADYAESFALAKPVADYITLNISCPNTTEGKTFEEPDALHALLATLKLAPPATQPPVLVKFSPDLDAGCLRELVAICEAAGIAGYIAVNTSTRREGLRTPPAVIAQIGRGGLSGGALRDRATAQIRVLAEATGGCKPIIGVGGISDAPSALEKLEAGAHLLQIYTGLVYQGPALISAINRGISDYLQRNGLESLTQWNQQRGLLPQ